MTAASIRPGAESREPFDRGAWLLLGFIGLLIVLCAVQLAYRFTLPTDGWRSESGETGCEYTLFENVAGAPSELQSGDVVMAVNGEVFDPACLGARGQPVGRRGAAWSTPCGAASGCWT